MKNNKNMTVISVKFILLLFFVSISFVLVASSKYLTEPPSYLKGGCRIADPEFIKCSTYSVQGLFEQLGKGIPGLEDLHIDPFALNKIKINQGNNNAVNVKVDLSKVKIHGLSKIIVKESRVSPKDYGWKTTLFLPHLSIFSDYELEGRILLIPLNGHGKMALHLSNMNVILYTKTILYEKGDFTFYNVTNTKVDYNLSGLKANFTNLFNGQKELEDSTNVLFNQNWEVLSEALKPVITQTIESILLGTMQKVFHFIPANFFVMDIPTSEQLYGKNKNA